MEGKMNDLTEFNSSNLESQLMHYAVSEVYLERMMKDIKPEWIINNFHNSIFEIVSEYYLTSGRMPNQLCDWRSCLWTKLSFRFQFCY